MARYIMGVENPGSTEAMYASIWNDSKILQFALYGGYTLTQQLPGVSCPSYLWVVE